MSYAVVGEVVDMQLRLGGFAVLTLSAGCVEFEAADRLPLGTA